MRRFCWNAQAELINEKEIRKIQLKKIKHQLRYVYERSAFYKRKFDSAGLKPGDIKTLDDYAKKVPFTTKNELRAIQTAKPPLGDNLCVPYNEVTLLITSSGTTGKATYAAVNARDWSMWIEALKRSFWMSGFRSGDVYLHALSLGTYISGLSYASAAREFGMAVIPIGVPTPAPRMLSIAKDCHVNVMVGTPSYAEHLAEKAREILNIEPRDFGLRKLGLGGEPGAGLPAVRKRIEQLWNADVRDRMGTPEIMPGNRTECYCKDGMHNCARDFIYDEILDPDTKEPIEPTDGVEGAFVYSALEQECYPLLRFYSNDHVKVATTDCKCGYPGITLLVVGRFDDMIKVKGLKVWPSAIRDIISTFAPNVTGEFSIILDELVGFALRGPFRLKVEYGHGVGEEEVKSLPARISSKITASLGFTPDSIEMVPPASLPRTEFKAKYIEVRERIPLK